MLQAISDEHDPPHVLHRGYMADAALKASQNSLEALRAGRQDGRVHVLLAASGSVATIKLPEIARALAATKAGTSGRLSIRVVLTGAAAHFLAGQAAEQPALPQLRRMPCVDAVYDDASEWGPQPWTRGGAILHIELRRWADILVIAPLSANTLAKIVNGMCDNLLTSIVRAWDAMGALDGGGPGSGSSVGGKKMIVVAPAMNTAMWHHPITARQIRVLQDDDWGGKTADGGDARETGAAAGDRGGDGWFEVLAPQVKTLACNDVGDGAMRDWREIVAVVVARLRLDDD